MTSEKVSAFWATGLEPSRAGELKRMKERVKPVAVDGALTLVAGAPVLGFHPVDYSGALSWRWLGPDPKGLVFVGKLDAGVAAVVLVLAGDIRAGVGALRLLWNGGELTVEPAPVPQRFAALAAPAVAWRAALPAPGPARDVSTLEIRLERTVPDPHQSPPTRLVGIALHAVVFAGSEA